MARREDDDEDDEEVVSLLVSLKIKETFSRGSELVELESSLQNS